MFLFVNLGGEAAEELEHCDLDKVDDPQGIEYILETIRAPLMVKGIYLKRKLLDDFERLSLLPSLRTQPSSCWSTCQPHVR